jgi:hypothetical protein
MSSVQIFQKKTHLHKNRHDTKYKYIEILDQDNNN